VLKEDDHAEGMAKFFSGGDSDLEETILDDYYNLARSLGPHQGGAKRPTGLEPGDIETRQRAITFKTVRDWLAATGGKDSTRRFMYWDREKTSCLALARPAKRLALIRMYGSMVAENGIKYFVRFFFV
jgi:hypothetical protein